MGLSYGVTVTERHPRIDTTRRRGVELARRAVDYLLVSSRHCGHLLFLDSSQAKSTVLRYDASEYAGSLIIELR